MYTKFSLIVILVLFTVACNEPKIDASTEESLQASSQKIREYLPESRRVEFDDALQVLVTQMAIQDEASGDLAQGLESKLHTDLNGKTAKQVFSEAIRLNEINEIVELEKKQQAQIVADDELSKVEIVSYELREFNPSYDFSWSNAASIDEIKRTGVINYEHLNYRAGDSVPVFDVSFKNGTEFPIYEVYFDIAITIPNSMDPFPFFSDTLVYPIVNGLKPGAIDRIIWSVRDSAWFNNPLEAMSEEGAQFTVVSAAIRGGKNGETWYTNTEFEIVEAYRLSDLKLKYKLD